MRSPRRDLGKGRVSSAHEREREESEQSVSSDHRLSPNPAGLHGPRETIPFGETGESVGTRAPRWR
jgi:hypothetical protein